MRYDYWDPRLELTNLYETYKLIEYIVYRNDLVFDRKVIVDLGCGWGTNAILLACGVAKSGFWQVPREVIGIDYDSEEINRATEATKHLRNLRFQCHDIREAFPLAPSSVDVVLSTYTLHNLRDDQKRTVFQQVAEVLNPLGRFIYIDVMFDEELERSAVSSEESLEAMWRSEASSLGQVEMQTLLDVHLDPKHPFSLILTGENEFPVLASAAEAFGIEAGLRLLDTTPVRGLVCCKRMIFARSGCQ